MNDSHNEFDHNVDYDGEGVEMSEQEGVSAVLDFLGSLRDSAKGMTDREFSSCEGAEMTHAVAVTLASQMQRIYLHNVNAPLPPEMLQATFYVYAFAHALLRDTSIIDHDHMPEFHRKVEQIVVDTIEDLRGQIERAAANRKNDDEPLSIVPNTLDMGGNTFH